MFLAWILGLGFIGNLMVHGHPAGHTVIHWIAVISVLLAAAGATLAAGSSLSSLVPFDAHRRSRSIRTGSVFARLFKPGAAAKPGRQWLVIALVFVVSLGLFGYSLLPESDGIGLAAARTQTTHLASGVSVLPCLLLVLAAVTLLALFYVAYRAVLARERSRPKHVMSAQGGLILGSATAAVVPAVLLIWPAHSPISVLPLVSGLLLLLYLSPVALIFPCAIAFIRLVELRGSARTGGGTVEIEAPAARRLALAPVLAAPLLLVASSSFPFVAQRLMVLVFATLEVVFVLIYFGLALMLQALKPGLKGTRVGGWDLVRLGLAAIPTIITLIGLKLPNTGDAVISWLQQVGAVVK